MQRVASARTDALFSSARTKSSAEGPGKQSWKMLEPITDGLSDIAMSQAASREGLSYSYSAKLASRKSSVENICKKNLSCIIGSKLSRGAASEVGTDTLIEHSARLFSSAPVSEWSQAMAGSRRPGCLEWCAHQGAIA